jgi:hypothetical protein
LILKDWKEPLIRSIFHGHDADEIMKIRIPNIDGFDHVAWQPDQQGQFSVKSAYNLALHLRSNPQGRGSSQQPEGERKIWDLIWKANVPPKIRVFAWQLASNTLAVQKNRSKRIKNCLPTCTICGMQPECEYHAVM